MAATVKKTIRVEPHPLSGPAPVATAVNTSVEAIRELQTVVQTLTDDLAALQALVDSLTP